MPVTRRAHRRLVSIVVAFLAVVAGGVLVGFLLGLARPRFGPDGDRLTWDSP